MKKKEAMNRLYHTMIPTYYALYQCMKFQTVEYNIITAQYELQHLKMYLLCMHVYILDSSTNEFIMHMSRNFFFIQYILHW